MKILKKYNTAFNYSIDPFYFENHSEITTTQHASSYWRVGREASYIMQYEVIFTAKNPSGDEHFLKYHKKYELQCLIENVEADAQEIIRFKELILLSTQLFLMENTEHHYPLLDFRIISVSDKKLKEQHANVLSEIINMKRIMGTLTLEEMSKEEREFVLGNNK